MAQAERRVLIPAQRLERWVANFEATHGESVGSVENGRYVATAADGSWFRAVAPFGRVFGRDADLCAIAESALPPQAWNVLLVRRGGYAMAHLETSKVVAQKVGRRHVQGQTKAGGQSQQRFARRRANQADAAFGAAAQKAREVLRSGLVVCGGDRNAVASVLELCPGLALEPVGRWLDVPDPRSAVLAEAIERASAIEIVVHNS